MSETKPELNPALIIGVFLAILGVCVLIAIAFTEGYRGQIVNLVCGLTIISTGGIFVWISRKQKPSGT